MGPDEVNVNELETKLTETKEENKNLKKDLKSAKKSLKTVENENKKLKKELDDFKNELQEKEENKKTKSCLFCDSHKKINKVHLCLVNPKPVKRSKEHLEKGCRLFN